MKTNQPIPPKETNAAKQQTSGCRAPRLVRLLPCPFCGFQAKTYCETVTCSNTSCKMHFPSAVEMHTPDEWNQRLGCDTGESYKLANEQLRSDLRKLTNRIKQLLHNRGWAAAEAVMDKMAEEISQPNA